MQVVVESKNVEVTQAIRNHAQKQAQKLTKVSQKIKIVRFFLENLKKKSNDSKANKVTLVLEVPGKDIVVKEHAVDMYEAINEAVESALRHLRKKLEKERAMSRNKN